MKAGDFPDSHRSSREPPPIDQATSNMHTQERSFALGHASRSLPVWALLPKEHPEMPGVELLCTSSSITLPLLVESS